MKSHQDTGLIALFGGSEAGRLIGTMMEAGFKEADLNYRFANISVEEGKMEEVLQAAEVFHMKGFNLDGPCSKEILPYLDMMSPAASIIGEVNSVRVQDGMLIGENSIGKGLVSCLMETGFSVQGKSICLLGSGRAARAAAVECALSGAGQIVILCRNIEEGKEIAWTTASQTETAVYAQLWEGKASIPPGTDALINCTPLGQTEEDLPDIDYEQITGDMVVGDLVLGRPDTAFLKRCRRQGAATVAGIDIMAAQASLNFFLWTEAMFPRTLMRDVLLEEMEGEAEEKAEDIETGEPLDKEDLLMEKMMEYFRGRPDQVQHFLKVYEFAKMIGRREKLDETAMAALTTAAILSSLGDESRWEVDQGNKREDGKAEKAGEAEVILRNLDYDDLVIDRALFLIDHCGPSREVDGSDHQILQEAIWLVKLYEDKSGKETAERVRREVFRSPSAIRFLDLLYLQH